MISKCAVYYLSILQHVETIVVNCLSLLVIFHV